MKFLFKKRLSFLLGGLFLLSGASFVLYKHYFSATYTKNLQGIVDFSYERDKKAIEEIFKKNWYWLIEGSPDFSPDSMMRHLTTSDSLATAGQLTMKALYDHGTLAGFSAYYMKNFYTGIIRFIAVDEQFRGKGYGKKLVAEAIKSLRARGAAKIRLLTRSTNYSAHKIYEANGMHKVDEEEGFVYFEKIFEK